MFWKKTKVKKQPLDGCCSKDEQIDMLRTLYAKAAKERDEANAVIEKLNKQFDDAIRLAKEALELAERQSLENNRLLAECLRARVHPKDIIKAIKDPCDWIKDEQKEEQK